MPPGMFPANILKYDASSVPILQLGLSSKTLREQEIFDIGNNFIRTPLGTVQGASVSYPFGGKQRAVMVDLNLEELYAKQLSPDRCIQCVEPAEPDSAGGHGQAGARPSTRSGSTAARSLLNDLNNLPIKTVNGATVYIKDVAQVRDGFQVQNNIVRTNGSRGVLITITRNGKASTLSIVNAVKAALPRILANVPPELKVMPLADQSVFVRASIQGVLREALIAAGLTGLMILLFLGSWRSTLIVCISIPLSILTSLCLLSLLGQTINVMTLGGLALAVGILVDDATVEIENTHRNIAMRKPLVTAVLDGASQIAVPTFVATLSICIVFVPVLLLTGTARYLFTPLAMAVVFAMLASYLLSRTLVPTMMAYLLESEIHGEGAQPAVRACSSAATICSTACSRRCGSATWGCWIGRCATAGACWRRSGFSSGASLGLGWLVGEDFFPAVDSGQMRLHARGPAGTRIEETEVRFSDLEREIRSVIPPDEIEMLIDNIGIPNSWPAIAQGDIPTISSADGEILISLNKEKHASHARLRGPAAQAPARAIPGHDVLLPAGQHHQPDSELRPARADRSAGGRAERRRQLRDRAEAGPANRAHSRGGGRACSPGGGSAGDPPGRGPGEGFADGTDAARRHQQHADFSQRQRHGGAEFLDELVERRQLQRWRADAAVPHRFPGRPAAHSHLGSRECR